MDVPSVKCEKHGKLCIIKTGMKQGPSHLKSFHICPENCGFVRQANVTAIKCNEHINQYVELRAAVFSKSLQQTRIYYRCTVGHSEGKTWCGSWDDINVDETSRSVLAEKTTMSMVKNIADMEPMSSVDESKSGSLFNISSEKFPRQPGLLSGSSVASMASAVSLDMSVDCFDDEIGLQQAKEVTESHGGDRKIVSTCDLDKLSDKKAPSGESATKSEVESIRKEQSTAALSFGDLAKRSNRLFKGVVETKSTPINDSFSYRDMTVVISSDDEDDEASVGTGSKHRSENAASGGDKIATITQHEVMSAAAQRPTDANLTSVKESASIHKEAGAKKTGNDNCSRNLAPYSNEVQSQDTKTHSSAGPDSGVSLKQEGNVTVIHLAKPIVPKSATMVSHKIEGPAVVSQGAKSRTVLSQSGSKPLAEIQISQPLSVVDVGELRRVMTERDKMSRLLASKQIVLQSVNLDKLPDGGAKLKAQIESLTDTLSHLDIEIREKEKLSSKTLHQLHEGSAGDSSLKSSGELITDSTQTHSSSSQSVNGTSKQAFRQTQLTDYVQVPANVVRQMNAGNAHQMAALYGGRMTESRLLRVGQVTTEAIEELHKQFETCPDTATEATDPSGLKVPLMTHQRQALAWLQWRENQTPPGGILADDMGLGKTLTMISLILKQRESSSSSEISQDSTWLSRDKSKPIRSNATLVICPASLVHQWSKEIERRVRHGLVDVIMYHGPNRDCSAIRLASATIVLTTYNLVSREVGLTDELKHKNVTDMPATDLESAVENDGVLMSVIWRRIIIDEGHCIKNHKSITALTVCRLKADIRWVLSGTPIQNNLLDMYALLRFLRCSPFDELKVWKRQVDNRTEIGMQRLNTLIKSLLLRRTKDQMNETTGKPLVSLPAKHSFTHAVQLSADERRVYERLYQESRASVMEYLRQHDEKARINLGSSGVPIGLNPFSGGDSSRSATAAGIGGSYPLPLPALITKSSAPRGGQILIYLLRLRQCCSHLSILREAVDVDVLEAEGLDLDLVEQMKDLGLGGSKEEDPSSTAGSSLASAFEISAGATKINELLKQLRKIREQSSRSRPLKSVVVSQWVTMLNVVEHHLTKEGFRCCTIQGNVPVKQRSQIVESFNTDPNGPTVMLVSLRAGGVGLNLIGGSNLFLLDMHWNPALELQACDRIYRVGQQQEVFIHKFVCKDTVEEKILQLQKSKMSLAQNVFTGVHSAVDKLSLNDLKLLFGLG